MKRLTPQQMLEHTTEMSANIKKASNLVVAVGLPKGKGTSKIYRGGMSVVEIGAVHEYGGGNVPQRSFLRAPFRIKEANISKALSISFKAVLDEGKDPETQLEKVGAFLQNVSKGAFTSMGYGTWQALTPGTISGKGSSKPLFDTGTLRGSITYEVRNAS